MKEYTGIIKLSLLLIVLPLFVWSFALKKSVNLWKWYGTEKAKLERLSKQELPVSAGFGPEYIGGSLLADGKLLEGMAESIRRENLGVVGYLPVVLCQEGNYFLYAGELILSGKYNGLLRSVEVLERKMPSVRIVSAGFGLYKERYDDQPELRLTLVLVELAGEKQRD